MQIRIKNFGPIKSFDLDLNKKLTIIFGKNNIGKSYSTSVTYLILKNLLKFGYKKIHVNLREFEENLRESFYATYEEVGNLTNRFSKKDMKLVLYTDDLEFTTDGLHSLSHGSEYGYV